MAIELRRLDITGRKEATTQSQCIYLGSGGDVVVAVVGAGWGGGGREGIEDGAEVNLWRVTQAMDHGKERRHRHTLSSSTLMVEEKMRGKEEGPDCL